MTSQPMPSAPGVPPVWGSGPAPGEQLASPGGLVPQGQSTLSGQTIGTQPTPVVAVHELRKAYPVDGKPLEILHGISLAVNAGEMVAIMGRSGSGKSTLLYCLTGLENPSAGEVKLFGSDIRRLSEAQRAILRRKELGFVFQSYNLLPTLSVTDNISLPALLGSGSSNQEQMTQILEDLRLKGMGAKRPAALSGGEQQRVALARVLLQQPRLICADEPTGALDSTTATRVLDHLTRIAHHHERAAIIVTHDPTVAARCDRVIILQDGLVKTELRSADPATLSSLVSDSKAVD